MTNGQEIRKLIKDMVDKVVQEYQPEKVILFGSYAYGRPDPDSDIDLLIIKQTQERPIDRRVAVIRIIYDPSLRVPVEPIVLTPGEIRLRQEIGDPFLEEVLTKGEVLYAA